MGSAITKRQRNQTKTKISITKTELQPRMLLDNQWALNPETESSFRTFEDKFNREIETKLSERLPLSSAQLTWLINKETDDTAKNFLRRNKTNNPKLNKLKEVLQTNSLKYTHINDSNSYHLYSRTISNLYKMFKAGDITADEVFDVYKKEVKGTYFLQGLKEIRQIISAFADNPHEADCLYHRFQDSSFRKFQKSQNKLRAY